MLRQRLEPGQYTSLRYTERLDEFGAVPSIGTVGDTLDNALAESVNSLYKAELIYRSEEHTSELQSHSFISYAVFCLKKKK